MISTNHSSSIETSRWIILRASGGSSSNSGDVVEAQVVEASPLSTSEIMSSADEVVEVDAAEPVAAEARRMSPSEVSLVSGEGDDELVAVGCDHAEPIVRGRRGSESATWVSCWNSKEGGPSNSKINSNVGGELLTQQKARTNDESRTAPRLVRARGKSDGKRDSH